MKTLLAEFLVRGAGETPCPCCGEGMSVIGTRDRKCKDSLGEARIYNIRRLKCLKCRKIHHELPDFMVPYKRYGAECIESAISNPSSHSIPADDSTLYRWEEWFHSFLDYWIGAIISIMIRTRQDKSLHTMSADAGTALQKIGRLVGNANGWLARIVRPIVNMNLWVHTRSAFLSEGG